MSELCEMSRRARTSFESNEFVDLQENLEARARHLALPRPQAQTQSDNWSEVESAFQCRVSQPYPPNLELKRPDSVITTSSIVSSSDTASQVG